MQTEGVFQAKGTDASCLGIRHLGSKEGKKMETFSILVTQLFFFYMCYTVQLLSGERESLAFAITYMGPLINPLFSFQKG